ncbi:MAG: dihydropteroate synthase, partial [Flavobacteriales bacterium]
DPNIFPVATGMEEHRLNALDFFRATEWIRTNLPGAHVSGGVSNVSFSFRGNPVVREAMHSAFLYHGIRAGMDLGIVNPTMLTVYDDIPADLLERVEDVLLDRRDDATERLIDFAEGLKGQSGTQAKKDDAWRQLPCAGPHRTRPRQGHRRAHRGRRRRDLRRHRLPAEGHRRPPDGRHERRG